MTTIQRLSEVPTCLLRGFARAMGVLASIPFVLFLICSGAEVRPELSWGSPQGMPLFVVLTMATLGVLIAWRRERIGGGMAVVCAAAVPALVCLGSGRDMVYAALMISIPYLGAGALFLACDWMTRKVGVAR